VPPVALGGGVLKRKVMGVTVTVGFERSFSDTESEPRMGLVQLSADVHALSLAAKPPGNT
jgi:hypothetical protein